VNVIWLKGAQEKYTNTISYLATNFSIKTAITLQKEVEKCEEYLKLGLQIGKYSKLKNAYRCVIKEYNLWIYTTVENDVVIIDFISTRSDHGFND